MKIERHIGLPALFVMLLCLFNGFSLSAQTLKMQFTFGDSGTTTTDSVSQVVLNLVTNSVATDLHGAAGSGVAGLGKCLNLAGGSYGNAVSPVVSTVNNNSINFGMVSNFTVTFWIKPRSDSPLYAGYFPRWFIFGANGTADIQQNNSIAIENAGANYAYPSVSAFIGTNGGYVQKDFVVTNPPPATNDWTFMAMTYDGTNVNYYSGSQTKSVAAQSLQYATTLPNGIINVGSSFSLFLGNRAAATRCFQGSMADVRFYTGAGSSSFLEGVREQALPPAPTGLAASGCGIASLTWNPVAGATNYIIKRSNASGAETNYDQTTATNYTDIGVVAGNYYYYTVAAISSTGVSSGNSSEASLFIGAPVIYTSPANQTISPGWQAAFSIVTGGAQTYQWRRNGNNLADNSKVSGSTNAVLTLNGLTLADSGAIFDCIVSSSCGSVTNNTPAVLTVVTNTIQLHFTFEDSGTTTTDSVSGVSLNLVDPLGNPTDLHAAAASGVGGIGQALDFSSAVGQGQGGPLASAQSVPAINLGNVSSFTVSLWVKPVSSMLVANSFARLFILGSGGITDDNQANSIGLLNNANFQPTTSVQGWVGTASGSATTFGAVNLPVGQWTYLVLTYDSATLRLYSGTETNAVSLVSTASLPGKSVNLGSSGSLFLGNRYDQGRAFQGLLDDVRFYLGAASSNYLESVRIAGGGSGTVVVTANDSPTIKFSGGSGQLVLQTTNSVNGALYVLESTPILAPANWTPVATNTGNGGPLTNDVTILPGATNQFYRIRLTSP